MTSATSTATPEVDRYLKAVAPHLAALPAEERAELLDDLAQHLTEVAAEPGPPLDERLGPPAAYAAELLASAGVPPAAAARSGPVATAVRAVERLRDSAAGREVARMWPSLRPAWWVARAYLAVYLLRELERDGASHGFPIPNLFGSPLVGLAALALAVPLSIRLGQRSLPGAARYAVLAGNVMLLIFGLALAGSVNTSTAHYVDGPTAYVTDMCLRNGDGARITNLYAYDAEGRLLDPTLLYDQNGHPIDNLCPDFDVHGRPLSTEYRRDVNGAPVINAFPRKQTVAEYPPRSGPYGQPGPTVPVNPPAVVVPRQAPTTTTTPPTSVP
ncbi:MAG TPA: hypothetical protein VG795_16665 [Acidimicrobiia bacterium]|nr:hypothetical protein [Acidimicrobiia bacterium]